VALAAAPETGGGGLRRYLKAEEWQLALPLALAFTAVFVAPLLLLIGVSFFNDEKISQPGLASWVKFFGDPFNYKVIADTLLLGIKTVCTTVLIGYPLALVYLDLPARLQRVLLFINPVIGQSVDRVYELAALYGEISIAAARRLVAILRDADPGPHQSARPVSTRR